MLRQELTFRAQDLEISLPDKNATEEQVIVFIGYGLNEIVNIRKLNITFEPNRPSIHGALQELGYPFDLESENFLLEAQFFVLTMMQSSRIDLHKRLEEEKSENKTEEKSFTASHSTLRSLDNICGLLRIAQNENRDSTNILHKLNLIDQTVSSSITQYRRLLPESKLSEEQFELCNEINQHLQEDFTLRRQMLLKRFDVTIQSFLWSQQVDGREEEILKQIDENRATLSILPLPFSVIDGINASISIAYEHIHRTNDTVESTSGIKKVLIGDVPDRCGRTNEMRITKKTLGQSSNANQKSKKNHNQNNERGNKNRNKSSYYAKR